MAKLDIIGGSGQGRSQNINASLTVNCYPELDPDPTSERGMISLIGTPGLALKYQVGVGPIRGKHPFAGFDFVVSGSELWQIAADGTTKLITNSVNTAFPLPLTSLLTSSGPVSMADNGVEANGIGGNQLCIADGKAAYIYDVVNQNFSIVTGGAITNRTTSFPINPTHVVFIDTYFIATNGTMGAWASQNYDGLDWDTLATSPVEGQPDNIACPVNILSGLAFFKQYNTEFWGDNGLATDQGFPYTRIPGADIPYGTCSEWSVIRAAGTVFWLGMQMTEDGGNFVGVVMLNGYSAMVVSTPAITYRMSQWTDWANTFAWSYSAGGHTFILFTSPGDNQTFCFDATVFPYRADAAWTDRSTYSDSPFQLNRHVCNAYSYFNNMHLVGDWQNGNIYEMHDRYYTDFGTPKVAIRRTPHIFEKGDLENVFVSKLQIDVESGTGNTGPVNPATATCDIVSGAISTIYPGDGGYDYLSAPTVTVQSADGAGSGAIITAQIAYGSVSGYTIVNAGSGYTLPPNIIMSAPTVNPNIGLSWSNDGGHSFSGELTKTMGAPGERRRSVIFRGLGCSRDKVFQIRMSDAAKFVLLGGSGEGDI